MIVGEPVIVFDLRMLTDRIGAFLSRPVDRLVLWIIAVLANVTAVQRVVFTYVELKKGWARVREEGPR